MIDHPIIHGSQYSRWNKEKGYEDCKIPSRLTGIPKYKEAEVLCIIDRIKQERDSLGLTDCKNVYDSLAFPDPETGKNGRGCYITIPTEVWRRTNDYGLKERTIYLKNEWIMVDKARKIYRDAEESRKDEIKTEASNKRQEQELKETIERNKENFRNTFKQHKVEFNDRTETSGGHRNFHAWKIPTFKVTIGNSITITGDCENDWSKQTITGITVKELDTINFIKILSSNFPNRLALIQRKGRMEESK